MLNRTSLLLLVFVMALDVWAEIGTEESIDAIKASLQSKKFNQAINQVDDLLKTANPKNDFLIYLKALASFHTRDFQRSINACQQLVSNYPDSIWLRKTTFLQAKCYFDLKDFSSAEAIYNIEVERLLSSKRKSNIAKVYIDLAEKVSRKPDENDLDAPPPNYEKAHNLYQHALELEISDDLKDELTYRLGRMMQLAGDFSRAIKDYQAYLTRFDADSGQRFYQAKYHLSECKIAQNQHQSARLGIVDLLELLSGVKSEKYIDLIRDARFLLTRAFHFPKPETDQELVLGVKAAEDFVSAYSEDPRSKQLMFEVAESYRIRQQTENAISAYQDFLVIASEDLAVLDQKMSSTFYIAELQFGQKKYAEAIRTWKQYLTNFPNGPKWTGAQSRIIDAEFQIGISLLTDKAYDDTIESFKQFEKDHPLDSRIRQILVIYGQMRVHQAEKNQGSVVDYQSAIVEWEKLVSKYPNTEESSFALFQIGQVYEQKLGELEKALESYRKLTWGEWQDQAKTRIRQMSEKQLKLTTERTFRTNEPAKIHLSLRNIKKLEVNLYKIDLEAYWRKMHSIKGIEELDLALIAPNQMWEHSISDYEKYKPIEQDIEIPIQGLGVYAVQVSDADLESTTIVIRSNIEAIIKASRSEVLVFAQDIVNHSMVSEATVIVSDGESIILEGKTGVDGVFQQKHDRLKSSDSASVFVIKDGNVASDRLDLVGLQFSKGLTPRGYIYTDRPAYHPGDRVSIRGIVRRVQRGSYVIDQDAMYRLSIIDARGRSLHEEEVMLSEFGTFTAQMMLDQNANVGGYRIIAAEIKADQKRTQVFNGNFEVQQFQTEKIQLTLDFPRQVYFRHQTVEATFTANYYYGQPVKGALIRYVLPDGQTFTEPTDDQGQLKITFDTSLQVPGSTLNFNGTIEGENVSVATSVFLAQLGFSIQISPSTEVSLSGEPLEVTVTTLGANGNPVGQLLEVDVLRKTDSPTPPVLSKIPWVEMAHQSATVLIETLKIETDQQTGKSKIRLMLTQGGNYLIRVRGTDRFDQPVVGTGRVTVSDDTDQVKLRIFADRLTTQVGAEETIHIHSRLEETLALITFEGDAVISYQILLLKSGRNPIHLRIGHPYFPNFYLSVAAIDQRQLLSTQKEFTVERQLKVSMRRQEGGFDPIPIYAPGNVAEIAIMATDQLGKPVQAEFSLALVEEAVFSLFPNKLMPIIDFFQAGIRRETAMRAVSSCRFRYDSLTRPVIKELEKERKRLEADKEKEEILGEMGKMPSTSGRTLSRVESYKRLGILREGDAAQADESSLGGFGNRYRQPIEAKGRANRLVFDRQSRALGELPQIRNEFGGAGYWIGSIVTDDQGKAIVQVPMPEKTTKWRLTGHGCSVDTLVGQIQVATITKKDFFLDLKMPSIVTEGDQLRINTQIHNLTDFNGQIMVYLKVNNQTYAKSTQIEALDIVDFIFDPIVVPAEDQLTVEVTAQAGKMSDGIRRQIPIQPWGMEYADTKSGIGSRNQTIFLEIPENQTYRRRKLSVSLGQSVERMIYNLAMNHFYPRQVVGPFYQRIFPMPGDVGSDLLAVAYAIDYAKKAGGSATDSHDLVERARILIGQLISTQNGDGGWSRAKGESDSLVTAQNFWALSEAERVGLIFEDQVVTNATKFLENAFVSANQDDASKVVILHALSTVGKADFAYANRLYRRRRNMAHNRLVYVALTFANLSRNQVAKELLDLIIPNLILPPKSDRMIDIETVGLTLLAIQKIDPSSSWIAKSVDFLISRRQFYGFMPYRAKGVIVAALAVFYQQTQFTSDDYRLTVFVNDQEIQATEMRNQAPNQIIEVPVTNLVDGRNKVQFQIDGRGRYAYIATLSGFSGEIDDPKSWDKPHVVSRDYYHVPLTHRGRSIGVDSSTKLTQLPSGDRTQVSVDIKSGYQDQYLIVDEFFPAGTTLVKDSISGNFKHYEIGDGVIRLYYPPKHYVNDFRYQLVSYSPGIFRVLPTVIRSADQLGRMRVGSTSTFTVLAPGEKSIDPYEMNDGELYTLGKANFEDKHFSEALPLLAKLRQRNPSYQEKEIAQMLLWIYVMDRHYDARKAIDTFEVLREKQPDLYIPFEIIRVVGKAYRDLGEFERASLVYSAIIDASFAKDSNVSAVVQDEGQFLQSIEFMQSLWRDYPDTAITISAYFAISQSLYDKVPSIDRLDPLVSKRDLLEMTAAILRRFSTLYPVNPLVDDATLSLINVLLDVEDFQQAIQLAKVGQSRYPESSFLSSFQYAESLGFFSMRKYAQAITSAQVVANGNSDDRDLARYILGQIYHAQKDPQQAINWYSQVKTTYPDAKESIDYFEQKGVSLPEVTFKYPSEKAELQLTYRNIKEVSIQVYQVDLMKLYLRQKNLSQITEVKLAGIEPQFTENFTLGDGKDYTDKIQPINLSMKEEGAYLVICRGDDLFTSGLVLITPLQIKVQEDQISGRVRVNIKNENTGDYASKVHVKAIGTENDKFISGKTDLRGVFIADGIRGRSTVIARSNKHRYAFYRGTQAIGTQRRSKGEHQHVVPSPQRSTDYLMNLRMRSKKIQSSNIEQFDQMRRSSRTGVQVQNAR